MARNLCELLYCNVLTDIKLESPNYIHQAISLQVIYCIVRVVPTPSSEQRSCARKSILKEGNFGVFALGWCCFKNQKVVVKFSLGEKALFELWYFRTLGSCAISSVGTPDSYSNPVHPLPIDLFQHGGFRWRCLEKAQTCCVWSDRSNRKRGGKASTGKRAPCDSCCEDAWKNEHSVSDLMAHAQLAS